MSRTKIRIFHLFLPIKLSPKQFSQSVIMKLYLQSKNRKLNKDVLLLKRNQSIKEIGEKNGLSR